MKEELVLAVESRHALEFYKPGAHKIDTYNVLGSDILNGLGSKCYLCPRPLIENNAAFKQIIPYCIIGVAHRGLYLSYRRTVKSDEDRLHDLHSIGFGGHVNAHDCIFKQNATINLGNTLFNGLSRELHEELGEQLRGTNGIAIGHIMLGDCPKTLTVSLTNNVDDVHLGIVFLFILKEEINFNEMEDGLEKYYYHTKEELLNMNLESWSKEVLPWLL